MVIVTQATSNLSDGSGGDHESIIAGIKNARDETIAKILI